MFTRPDHIQHGTPEYEAYMASKYATRDWLDIRRDVVEFEAVDAKGRVHGYSVKYWQETFTRAPADENNWRLVDDENLGLWFVIVPHALKDGKEFGACQPSKRFRTMAEAERAGAAMIARARKASLKKK